MTPDEVNATSSPFQCANCDKDSSPLRWNSQRKQLECMNCNPKEDNPGGS